MRTAAPGFVSQVPEAAQETEPGSWKAGSSNWAGFERRAGFPEQSEGKKIDGVSGIRSLVPEATD